MAEAAEKEQEQEQPVDLENIREQLNELQEEPDEEEAAEQEEAEPEGGEEEYTPEELEAIEEGWQPDGKDKDGNTLSAKEYMSRRPLFQRIKNLNEKIEGLSNTVESLQEHNKLTVEKAIAERTALMSKLKAAKKEAYKEMDVEEAERIDAQLEELEKEAPEQAPKQQYTPEQWDERYQKFVDENAWYKENVGMSAAANHFGGEYKKENPDCAPEELFNNVMERIKESFPDYFAPATSKRPTTVAKNTTRTKPKSAVKKHKFSDIPQEHQQMARVIINSGVSEDEYLKQYFMGE